MVTVVYGRTMTTKLEALNYDDVEQILEEMLIDAIDGDQSSVLELIHEAGDHLKEGDLISEGIKNGSLEDEDFFGDLFDSLTAAFVMEDELLMPVKSGAYLEDVLVGKYSGLLVVPYSSELRHINFLGNEYAVAEILD